VRLVLDTNTALSALLWKGPPHRIVGLAQAQGIVFFTSPVLLAELEDVLGRSHLAAAVAATGLTTAQLMDRYRRIAIAVHPPSVPAVSRDPDDDHVLACALAAEAQIIVSGDSDLLVLKEHRGIPILKAADALNRLIGD